MQDCEGKESTTADPLTVNEWATQFDTIFSSVRPLSRDNVKASVSQRYQRLAAPAIDDDAIDAHWRKLTAPDDDSTHGDTGDPQPRVFNALKFRLHGVEVLAGESLGDDAEGGTVGSLIPLPEQTRSPKPKIGESARTSCRCSVTTPLDHTVTNTTSGEPGREAATAAPLCVLKLGITDYKTSMGTTTHVAAYERCAASNANAVDAPLGSSSTCSAGGERNVGAARDSGGVTAAAGAALRDGQVEPTVCVPKAVPRPPSGRLDSEGDRCRPAWSAQRADCFLANALAVEAMTITGDNCAVLFRRSPQVSEYPGYYCCPGGHPEPSHILHVNGFTAAQRAKHHSGSCQGDAALQMEVCKWFRFVRGDVIVEELFRSAVLEVAEEIGVPLPLCTSRGLVSIIRNAATRKPDACFIVDVQCSNEDVRRAFETRSAVDAFESEEGSLVFMDLGQVRTPADVVSFVNNRLCAKITPASLAALLHGIQSLAVSR